MKLEKLGVKPKDFLLIPNFITYIRFLMIPLLLVFFFLGRTTKNNVYIIGTVICLAISALSDVFDGFAARKLGQVSQLGRMLDPIADKLTLIAVAVCMCFFAPSVIPLMLILVVKDLLMLIGGIVVVSNKIPLPASKWYGKASTVIFYLSTGTIVFLKAVFNIENTTLDVILYIITALAMAFSLANYLHMYIGIMRNRGDGEK